MQDLSQPIYNPARTCDVTYVGDKRFSNYPGHADRFAESYAVTRMSNGRMLAACYSQNENPKSWPSQSRALKEMFAERPVRWVVVCRE